MSDIIFTANGYAASPYTEDAPNLRSISIKLTRKAFEDLVDSGVLPNNKLVGNKYSEVLCNLRVEISEDANTDAEVGIDS